MYEVKKVLCGEVVVLWVAIVRRMKVATAEHAANGGEKLRGVQTYTFGMQPSTCRL